jgi:hypothetical protein
VTGGPGVPVVFLVQYTWAEISIFAPFWGRNTPIQGRLRTQYILFPSDRPTLQNWGWTGNRDITSSRLDTDAAGRLIYENFTLAKLRSLRMTAIPLILRFHRGDYFFPAWHGGRRSAALSRRSALGIAEVHAILNLPVLKILRSSSYIYYKTVAICSTSVISATTKCS